MHTTLCSILSNAAEVSSLRHSPVRRAHRFCRKDSRLSMAPSTTPDISNKNKQAASRALQEELEI